MESVMSVTVKVTSIVMVTAMDRTRQPSNWISAEVPLVIPVMQTIPARGISNVMEIVMVQMRLDLS